MRKNKNLLRYTSAFLCGLIACLPASAATLTYPEGTTLVFNPSATLAGVNVGAIAGDPSAPVNGDIWYDSTANELTARINGANVALGSGSGSGDALTSNPLSQFAATTSAQLRGVMSDESGTGALVFAGGALGAATATTINGLTVTSTTGTLTLANGKTLTGSNTLTFAGTDGSTLNVGTGGTLGTAAFVGTSAGGNSATDSGKAALYQASGGLVLSGGLQVYKLDSATIYATSSPINLTAARAFTWPDSGGTYATQEWVGDLGYGIGDFLADGTVPMTGALTFTGTTHAGIRLNNLTSVQRDALTPLTGYTIWNTTTGQAEAYSGSAWGALGGSGGTLTSTYVGYGNGSNALTGEAAFTYTAASDLLTVPNIYASTAIELGAATDTTLTRSAAGAIAVEGVAVPTISSASTLTNKRLTSRVATLTDAATVTPASDSYDGGILTTLSQTTDFANPTGTPTDFQRYTLRIKSTTARTITFGGTQYRFSTDMPAPTATSGSSLTDYLVFQWNAADSKWDCVGKNFGF